MEALFMNVIIALMAYLIGSISFSYLFTKNIMHEDIRQKGSGNPGTTNMLRSYGWKLGLLTLVCDVLKGIVAVFIGGFLGGPIGMYVASVFVIVGHNWSCYLRFRGGKGIAATIGVLLMLLPLQTLIIFGLSVLIVYITKFMSLGSIIGLILSATTTIILHPDNFYLQLTVVIIAALGVFAHRGNIKRLSQGNEKKLHISSGKTEK